VSGLFSPARGRIRVPISPLIHGLDQVLEGLVGVFALDLHGGGHLSVFLVELLGQDGELLDGFDAGQGFVYGVYLPLD
jgi:hypothetical protein